MPIATNVRHGRGPSHRPDRRKPRPTAGLAAAASLAVAAALASCNFPPPGANPLFDATAALETAVSRLFTQSAPGTPSPAAGLPPSGTAPGLPGSIPGEPTVTPIATGCIDRASFIADLTVVDDTAFAPGAAFTKTWRLRNNGTCGWAPDYALVFAGGEDMHGPASTALGRSVPPGGEIDLSISQIAPDGPGTHRGNWQLMNSDGRRFGIGPSGDLPFWVQIIVGSTPTPGPINSTVYSFIDHVCEAEWRSQAGLLPCPGSEDDPNGFVIVRNSPRFENGTTDDEPAIYTHPQWTPDGVISGRFPPVYVPDGTRLLLLIGCAWNSPACNVTFQVNYRLADGPLQNLGQWTEIYDGQWRVVEVDLSALAGQSVSFILAVTANGDFTQDRAYWLTPVIVR